MNEFTTIIPSRISPGAYKDIVTKVRKLYRKNSPYGCSQNVRAEVRDIDKAVEANRLREQEVNEFARNEMKKLNLMQTNTRFLEKSHTITPKRPKKIINKLSISKPKTAGFKVRRKMSDFSQRQVASFRATSAAYSQKTGQESRDPAKTYRLASIESIMKSCDELKPTLKPEIDLIEGRQSELESVSNDVKEFMIDLEDCSKLAENEDLMKKLMDECKNSRKISRVLKVEKGIKDEMLTVTRKIVQFGGYKVWRHNHAEFMASAEKILNSIPKTRS